MLGLNKTVGIQPTNRGLGWPGRLKLEGCLWAGVTVIIWEMIAPLRSMLGPEINNFAEWVALGLAGVATLTAIQIKRRLWRNDKREQERKSSKPPNPLGLIDVLREHGVREFGSMYLYMPIPKLAKHQHAWAWLEMLDMKGLIKGEPWHIKADHVRDSVRESHPGLFEGSPIQFDVYRLDWRTLTEMLGDDFD